MRSLSRLVEYLYEESKHGAIILRRDGLEIEYKKLTITQSVDNSTGRRGVSAANATRTGSTERVFLVERAGVSPANGSSTPLHPSKLIDEHSIRSCAISDENSLEGTGIELREKKRSIPEDLWAQLNECITKYGST